MGKRDKASATERSRARKLAKAKLDKERYSRVERGWKYRLYLTPAQEGLLDGQAHTARALWNLIHSWWLTSLEIGLTPNAEALEVAVRQGRKDIDWLADLPAQASQQVIRHYLEAWRRRWKGIAGPPRFHGRGRCPHSVTAPQARDLNLARVSHKFATAHLPLIGEIRLRYHRAIPTTAIVTGATVTKQGGHWMLVVKLALMKPEPRTLVEIRPVVGYDRGVVLPLAGSDGSEFTHDPWLTSGQTRRLYRLERSAARKREARWACSGGKGKGRIGNNERVDYDAIAHVKAREARRREDWQHKVAWQIASTVRIAVFEDLHLKNMTASAKGTVENPGANVAQKAGLNRAVLGEALAALVDKVTYKLEDNGGAVARVPAPGTSTTCHRCGSIRPGQRESQALFRCRNLACGWAGNADYNAACNVLNRALAGGLIPSLFGGTPKAARSRYELETPSGDGAVRPSGPARKRESTQAPRPVAA